MEKRREPFELVTHMDEDGTRATACYRTRVFKDDGTVDTTFQPLIEGVTLAELGDKFPWKEFADAALQSALLTIEQREATISAKDAEKTAALAAKDAEIVAKTAENATNDVELAAERAITIAAKALAAKTVEVAAVEKDDPARADKEQEAVQLAAQVVAKDAELTVLKLPAEEKRKAGIRGEIDRLQASLGSDAGKGEG